MYMLKVFAPPAASVPPSTVATINQSEGIPESATTMVGTVVMSRSSMIRGLVNATKAATRDRDRTSVTSLTSVRLRPQNQDHATRVEAARPWLLNKANKSG